MENPNTPHSNPVPPSGPQLTIAERRRIVELLQQGPSPTEMAALLVQLGLTSGYLQQVANAMSVSPSKSALTELITNNPHHQLFVNLGNNEGSYNLFDMTRIRLVKETNGKSVLFIDDKRVDFSPVWLKYPSIREAGIDRTLTQALFDLTCIALRRDKVDLAMLDQQTPETIVEFYNNNGFNDIVQAMITYFDIEDSAALLLSYRQGSTGSYNILEIKVHGSNHVGRPGVVSISSVNEYDNSNQQAYPL